MHQGDLYWLIYWDGHKHHVGPHRAETRELATRHGLEHEPGMTLKAVISAELNLTVPQMLELAESCLLYTSPSPRDRTRSRMPSSA